MPHSTATIAPARPGSKASASNPKTATQKALEKLGLKRDIDLALHLPLRYEDETRITKLRDAREGDTVQIEARVTDCEVSFRPRASAYWRAARSRAALWAGLCCTRRFAARVAICPRP